jgi:hypothetical protein
MKAQCSKEQYNGQVTTKIFKLNTVTEYHLYLSFDNFITINRYALFKIQVTPAVDSPIISIEKEL